MPYQLSLFDENQAYENFVDKFKPKKTTDDCYTPPYVYDVIRDWACQRYGKNPEDIIRPFYPGGDYESEDYPEGCFILDNPPFSILSTIIEFYAVRKVDFFLFCPTLTALSRNGCKYGAVLISSADVVYENGAVVPTSFVTNQEPGVVLRTVPDLSKAIEKAQKDAKSTMSLPKYIYPNHVVTAAIAQRWAKYGVEFAVRRDDCIRISGLDMQRPAGKSIFGGGLLLSERAAAERAAAIEWPLSDREREIIARLGSSCL